MNVATARSDARGAIVVREELPEARLVRSRISWRRSAIAAGCAAQVGWLEWLYRTLPDPDFVGFLFVTGLGTLGVLWAVGLVLRQADWTERRPTV